MLVRRARLVRRYLLVHHLSPAHGQGYAQDTGRLVSIGLALISAAVLGASPVADHATLPPDVRAKLLMALLGLVVLGIGLVVVVVLAGRSARRLARDGRSASRVLNRPWQARPSEPTVPPDATGPTDEHGQPHETRRFDETGRTGQ